SWNYLRSSREDGNADVAVTYWMNRLQGIDEKFPLFVILVESVTRPGAGEIAIVLSLNGRERLLRAHGFRRETRRFLGEFGKHLPAVRLAVGI
ncbi:hypothetical protein AB9F35_34025, partial [Rhizobium leguminosarum]|uniref:hypothetical protein n=1 Tax=Rhizobium leguminosarum TaxID=384 RepID=UPI003F9E06F2